MLSAIVRWSLARPRLIAVAALLLFLYGCVVLAHAKFDVFPEFVPAQAEIQTEAPGLTAEQIQEATRRGRRLDETKPGSGLGLSIVTDLVALYQGRLTLSRSPDGGLRAEIDLPAA